MKKKIIAIMTTIFLLVTMIPTMVFAEQDYVDVSVGIGDLGTAECEVTFTDGRAPLILDYQTWLENTANFGGKLFDELKIDDISTPSVNGDNSAFLGWVVVICGDDPDLYPVEIAGPMETIDLMNYVIPTQNPIQPGEPFSLNIQPAWDDRAWEDDSAMEAGFAVSANGGKLLVWDDMDGVNVTADCYNSTFMAPGPVGNAVPFKILSAEKEGSVLAGWTVYEADALIFDEREASVGLNFGDPDMEILLYDTYTDGRGVDMNVYISLLFSKVIDQSMSTEELYDLGGNGKSYYAVANWTSGTVQEMTVNGQAARLEMATDIPAVDSNLKDKFTSVEQIKDALLEKAFEENDSFKEDSMKIEYMEITLKVKDENGMWVTATPENFPEEGIEVVIPYPAGIDKDAFQFSVLHMFTHGSNAGSIEVLTPELEEDGLHVVVHSLSPFAVAYQEAEEPAPQVPAETEKKDGAPATGDYTNLMPWMLVMAVTVAAGTAVVTRRRFH